jgi:hypothetical protein
MLVEDMKRRHDVVANGGAMLEKRHCLETSSPRALAAAGARIVQVEFFILALGDADVGVCHCVKHVMGMLDVHSWTCGRM